MASVHSSLFTLHAFIPPCFPSPSSAPAPPRPTVDRNVAGLAVQREGETLLFDCGEGNQRQMMRYGVGFSFTRDLLHPLSRRPHARRHRPAPHHGPAGPHRARSRSTGPGAPSGSSARPSRSASSATSSRSRSWRSSRATGSRDEYDIVVFETEHRADTVGYALARAHPAGPVQPRPGARAGHSRGPALGPAAQGRDGDAGRMGGRSRRRIWWVRRGAGAPWSTPATPGPSLAVRRGGARAPTCWSTRPPSAATSWSARRETGHSTAAEAARVARGGRGAAPGAHPHQPALHPRRARAARGGAGGVSRRR